MTRRQKLLLISLGIISACLAFSVLLFIFWLKSTPTETEPTLEKQPELSEASSSEEPSSSEQAPEPTPQETPIVSENPYSSSNCTTAWGSLMLINPNFTVDSAFIAQRRTELIDLTATYGILEGKSSNGTPLLDVEAAVHLNDMLTAYAEYNPGHTMVTRSCFRSRGTSCGRLCVATGGSDHHTGYTCDLIDPSYGTSLDTAEYGTHLEWQWLRANSYKYGFIDRFPEAWAGGSMSEPANIDANGSTGLFETWHYRYVGLSVATEIATGKYNNGAYDSLEHYLKATGKILDLTNMQLSCQN